MVTWQLYQMGEKMRANSIAATAGFYLNAGADNDCITSACTALEMAQSDIFNWNSENGGLFPAGAGTITQPGGAGNDFIITMRWDGNRKAATGTGCDTSNIADLLCNTVAIALN